MKKNAGLKFILGAAAAAVAAWACAQAGGFQFAGLSARVITPNGDGINDVAFIRFCNPSDSDVSGRFYTLLGAEVATLGPRSAGQSVCPSGSPANFSQQLRWDGRSNGSPVRSGIYVYSVRAENRSYSGTLLVVR